MDERLTVEELIAKLQKLPKHLKKLPVIYTEGKGKKYLSNKKVFVLDEVGLTDFQVGDRHQPECISLSPIN